MNIPDEVIAHFKVLTDEEQDEILKSLLDEPVEPPNQISLEGGISLSMEAVALQGVFAQINKLEKRVTALEKRRSQT